MKITLIKIIASIMLSTILLSSTALGTLRQDQSNKTSTVTTDIIPYEGTLKVYIVEPTSRYKNRGIPYHFGFLDYAIDTHLLLDYEETYSDTVTWNGSQHGFGDMAEDNIMVIAAVFNPKRCEGHAYPPFKNPFDAHYLDAAAAAKPNETGKNMEAENFTHTVFLEEATATYCGFCAKTRDALHSIYESQDYPFYYAAMVGDANTQAFNRLIYDYNLYGYPTCFVDGGYRVVLGGYDDEGPYRSAIKSSGKRNVHEFNLSVSLEWLGNAVIEVTVEITNNELLENSPPEKPVKPSGETEGRPGTTYNYTCSTTDPDENEVCYWFDWGDGNESGWTEYFRSGREITLPHKYTQEGIYELRVKSKDTFGFESEWSDPLEIQMPRLKTIVEKISKLKINSFIQNLLEILEKRAYVNNFRIGEK